LLACLALSALFYPHRVSAALGINEVVTAVKNQVAADDHVARTLQNAISYKSPDWDKAIQPQLVKREEQIKVENERLAKEKAEAEAKAKQAAAVAQQPVPAPIAQPSGDKTTWMAQAGIPQSDWGYVDYIVTRESGWRHLVVNSIGATGLCQALPGRKMSSAGADYLTNPVTQLRWCNSYAIGRYGSWAGAVAFWQSAHWW